MNLSDNKTAVVVVLTGIVLALPALYGRIRTETANRSIEILVDPETGVFENAAVYEEYTFAELAATARATRWSPGLEHPFENAGERPVVLIFDCRDVFAEASTVAKLKFGDSLRTAEKNGKYYILFENMPWSRVASVGAGIVPPPSEDKRVYIRPVNDEFVNSCSIARIFNGRAYEGVIFKGSEVLGYPYYLQDVNRHLKTAGLLVFNIEFAPQRGMRKVTEGVPVALLHSVPPNLKEDEAVRRAIRALRERSARGFYFRDIYQAKALSEKFDKYVLDIDRGSPEGAVIEKKTPAVAFLAVVFTLCGLALMAGVKKTAVFSATLFLLILILAGLSGLRHVLIILTAGLVGPISVKLAVDRSRSLFRAIIFIITFSFLGGILVSASGWAGEFYTKITPLRGVKLSFILPVFTGAVMFFGRDLKNNLNKSVKWGHLLAFAAAVAALGVLVFRSANVRPEFVLRTEIAMRNLLEDVFVWRPRFKEFLFAHPLLVAGLHIYYKQKKLGSVSKIMLVLGITGSASVINSFIHVHTPIAGSIIRSFYGWALGLIASLFFIIIIQRWLPAQK